MRAEFEFMVDGLCVARDALGATFMLERRENGYDVSISLPPQSETLDTGEEDGIDAYTVEQFYVTVKADIAELEIRNLKRPEKMTANEPFSLQDQLPDRDPRIISIHDTLRNTAEIVARNFLSWVRLQARQYWVRPLGFPQCIASNLFDDASEQELSAWIAMGVHGWSPILKLSGRPALGGVEFRKSLRVALREHQMSPVSSFGKADPIEGDLPERLLSSAIGRIASEDQDPATAVFLAALACEVKVKSALRTSIRDDMLPLLDIIIDNPRDVTLSASQHFDKLSEVILGRSLRRDDQDLWKSLTRFVEKRNMVAHRGFQPSVHEAEESLNTALRVFRWLDTPAD